MPGRRTLQGTLDNEVHQVTLKILDDGLAQPDVNSIYQAIQRSNSSLKRKPKKVLQSSLERVLDYLDGQESDDSEAAIEEKQTKAAPDVDIMNKSLRASLRPAIPLSPPITSESERRIQRDLDGQAVKKRRKHEAKIESTPPMHVSLFDIGGVDDVAKRLHELLTVPLTRPEEYTKRHISMPRGILLHGPPGCGKTMISRAFASALRLPFIEILGPSIVSGMSGESEKQMRDRFDEAKKQAPCLIFIDEIDAITPKRDTSQSQMEKRIVAQLLVSMDDLAPEKNDGRPVIVLAATNRPDSLDPALRRGGRFDTEINMGVPNESVRELILKAQTRRTSMSDNVDFKRLAKMTAGFVGADLQDLVGKAGSWSMSQYREALERQAVSLELSDMDVDGQMPVSATIQTIWQTMRVSERKDLPKPEGCDEAISMEAFLAVLPSIIPSSKREGFATVPDVSWDDIGALRSVREELEIAIVAPIKEPERYAAVGIEAPTGVLLWGPPGCGKTLLAKAVAAESKANFISVKGPELLDKFVGESERAVRQVFTRARSSVPCVIFFDELDALVPKRDPGSSSEASARVVNTLLTELDGLENRAGIYVVAATNRPEIIDEAMLRPGRLETRLFVDLPGPDERVEILRALIRNKPYNTPEIAEVARSCHGYSGADLGSLPREAGHNALRRNSGVGLVDFEHAVTRVSASVTNMKRYHDLRKKFETRIQ